MTRDVSRFAPSTTGQAHPGTLLSALLVWLDVRAASGHVTLPDAPGLGVALDWGTLEEWRVS